MTRVGKFEIIVREGNYKKEKRQFLENKNSARRKLDKPTATSPQGKMTGN